MKIIYQDKSNNCMQAAVASLLNLELNEVPNFKDYGPSMMHEMIKFVMNKGYDYYGSLSNPIQKISSWHKYKNEIIKVDNDFDRLEDCEGINEYFIASVYSIKHFDPLSDNITRHAVVIDKKFNIINPVGESYKGITKFPLHDIIGYNGIIDIYLIRKHERI
jgi:hypothetical protein